MKVLKSLSITPLYTLDDIIYIKNKLKFVENIAIVGGGTIAFKLIRALDKFEKNIIIVEKAPHILYKKLDEKASQIVKMEYLKRANIDIFENNEIIQYNHVKGILTSVTLKSGVEIDCELVILAAGINPNIDFLDETQFSINKGIVVSNTLQTNVPNVYAVGDVAETPDPLYNGSPILHHSWEFAIAQSKVAAINMLGHKVNFNNTIYLNKMTIGNIGIISAGIIDPKEGEYQILERFRIINSLYRKFVWENERLIGIILIQQLDENFPIKQVKKWVRSILITQNIDKTHKEKHLHRNFKFLDWEKNRKPSRVLNIF